MKVSGRAHQRGPVIFLGLVVTLIIADHKTKS
jgi:hypothetical protein